MSEVYVLVKQVPGRPNGEFTIHGVTELEEEKAVWEAASESCIGVWLDTDSQPNREPWQVEEATDE